MVGRPYIRNARVKREYESHLHVAVFHSFRAIDYVANVDVSFRQEMVVDSEESVPLELRNHFLVTK
jgi:hypothetical protein